MCLTYLRLVEHHLIRGELGHCAGLVDAGDPAGAHAAETRKRGAPGYYTHEPRTRLATAQLQQTRRSVSVREQRPVRGSVRSNGQCVGRINPPGRGQLCGHVMRALLINSVQSVTQQKQQQGDLCCSHLQSWPHSSHGWCAGPATTSLWTSSPQLHT